jgi:hypothetical protein
MRVAEGALYFIFSLQLGSLQGVHIHVHQFVISFYILSSEVFSVCALYIDK